MENAVIAISDAPPVILRIASCIVAGVACAAFHLWMPAIPFRLGVMLIVAGVAALVVAWALTQWLQVIAIVIVNELCHLAHNYLREKSGGVA